MKLMHYLIARGGLMLDSWGAANFIASWAILEALSVIRLNMGSFYTGREVTSGQVYLPCNWYTHQACDVFHFKETTLDDSMHTACYNSSTLLSCARSYYIILQCWWTLYFSLHKILELCVLSTRCCNIVSLHLWCLKDDAPDTSWFHLL